MRAVLPRLVIPVILLAAVIAASVAVSRFANDPLPEVSTSVDTAAPDTPVFSVRRAPELLTGGRAADELSTALDGWVATLPPSSCFVVSAGGDRLYEHQANLPLTPASNMKLLTALAALQQLGPDYTFETRVSAVEAPDTETGTLAGNLFIIGGGDPLLMTEGYVDLLPPEFSTIHSSLETMAEQTVATNLSTINGGVRVDESRYDDQRAPAEISQDLLAAGRIGSLSAAMFDQGFVGFKEGYAGQQPVEGQETPPLVRSTAPAADFAANFDDLLEALSVIISSRADQSVDTPPDLVNLFVFRSPPLSAIVEQMLVNSDNTTAESLVKELGLSLSGVGSTTSGTLAMGEIIRSAGIDDAGLFAFDGSGLSDGNTATCSLLHDALNSTHRDTLAAALPVAGESGTIASAFVGTKGESRIRAKSGLLARASALSGYFVTDPGVELTFSLIINVGEGETITEDQVAGWQRPLPGLLASYPSGPALEELGPIGVVPTDGG